MKLFLMNLPVNRKAGMKIQFQFMMINHVLLSNVREVRGKRGRSALGGECPRFTIRKEEYFIPKKSVKKEFIETNNGLIYSTTFLSV